VIALLFVLALGPASLLSSDNASHPKNSLADGELLYKTHCTRCHSTPPGLSERQTQVIVRHMRVRANLLSADYQSVLGYLSQNVKAKK
jgi:hypothetical protein